MEITPNMINVYLLTNANIDLLTVVWRLLLRQGGNKSCSGRKANVEIKYQTDYSSTRTLNKRNPNYSNCAHYHQIRISFKRALACAVSYLVLNNPPIKLEIAGGSFLHSCTYIGEKTDRWILYGG